MSEDDVDIQETTLPGVLRIQPKLFADARGAFAETYRHGALEEAVGHALSWKQNNVSVSTARTIRGLHFSTAPGGQAKYVTCVKGTVWDVIMDVRVGSPAFGAYTAVTLAADHLTSVYIPSGFAHGFLALTEGATVHYLLSSAYDPGHEYGISPFDPVLALGWNGVPDPVLSDKDRDAPGLYEARDRGILPFYADTANAKK